MEELDTVPGHIDGQRVGHVVGVGEVAVLEFVGFEELQVLLLVTPCLVVRGLE